MKKVTNCATLTLNSQNVEVDRRILSCLTVILSDFQSLICATYNMLQNGNNVP